MRFAPGKRGKNPIGFFAMLRMTNRNTKKPSDESEGFESASRVSRTNYFFAAPRLNFVVNFSTRPAVSTRRFSPV